MAIGSTESSDAPIEILMILNLLNRRSLALQISIANVNMAQIVASSVK